jgi:hypothetical protein
MALPLITNATAYGNYADRPAANAVPSGGIFISTDKDMINYSDGSNWLREASRTVFSQITTQGGDTLSNFNAYTSFATTHSVAANTMVDGRVIRVYAAGVWNSDAVVGPSIGFRLVFGGGPTAIMSPPVTPTGLTAAINEHWELDAKLIFRSIGAGGTVWSSGFYRLSYTAGSLVNNDVNGLSWFNPRTATVAWDTTAAQTLAVQAIFDTADVDNNVTMNQLIVDYSGGI